MMKNIGNEDMPDIHMHFDPDWFKF